MQIIINGKSEEIQQEISLTGLLTLKSLDPNKVVVEYNGEIVKREDWSRIVLKDGDSLEVLRFVGGG